MKLKDIIGNINNDILSWDLEKIIEVTYSYENLNNGFFYNITLFEEFWWIKYFSNDFNFNKLRETLINKLNIKLWLIDKYINKISQNKESEISQLLKWSLKYIKNILNITLEWIDFELEKAWYSLNISWIIIKDKILKIENLEKKCFWEKIHENKDEMRLLYTFLSKVYSENKWSLNNEEKNIFLGFLTVSSRFLDKKFNLDENYLKNNTYIPKEFSFNNKYIKREYFMEIYDYILKEIYNFPQRCKITWADSIYDGEKFLEIPNNDKSKEITYEIFLNLISHEIESHYVNSYNWKQIFWNFRGAKNLEKEEWLAKCMEYFLVWHDITNILPNPEYFPKILFSEIVNWSELYKFLEIYSKLHFMYRTYWAEFLRQKRNYPLNYVWWQHKDITYWRWALKIIKYLKNNNDFSQLFLWKVWFNDIKKVQKISKWQENNIIYPLFIWEILRSYMISKEENKPYIFNNKSIASKLIKKYNFKWIEKFNLESRLKEKKEQILELFSKIDNAFNN